MPHQLNHVHDSVSLDSAVDTLLHAPNTFDQLDEVLIDWVRGGHFSLVLDELVHVDLAVDFASFGSREEIESNGSMLLLVHESI